VTITFSKSRHQSNFLLSHDSHNSPQQLIFKSPPFAFKNWFCGFEFCGWKLRDFFFVIWYCLKQLKPVDNCLEEKWLDFNKEVGHLVKNGLSKRKKTKLLSTRQNCSHKNRQSSKQFDRNWRNIEENSAFGEWKGAVTKRISFTPTKKNFSPLLGLFV
jgi:hypothetical protein